MLTSTGQNILDSLEEWRGGSEIVGINSKTDVASNFRLERAYVTPPASPSREHLDRLAAILLNEQPDLILPGRDDNVDASAALKEIEPSLSSALPAGPLAVPRMLDDRWARHEFALSHGPP